MHVRPDRSSGRVVKNGEPAASGCTAEQTSCKKPGSVSSAERAPPPIVAFASQTTTEHPARASVIAAARPFGPEPTTTASYSVGMLKWASDLGARFPISCHCATRWPFHAIELRDANQYRIQCGRKLRAIF